MIEAYEALFERYVARSIAQAPDDVDGKIYVKSSKELKIGAFYDVVVLRAKTYDLYTEVKEDRL